MARKNTWLTSDMIHNVNTLLVLSDHRARDLLTFSYDLLALDALAKQNVKIVVPNSIVPMSISR